MRIEVPPISAGPSQDPTNPGIEKEAPAENSPFYPLVMERIEDLHSGRLAGKGRKELRESDSAGGESREDREAVPKSSVSDPAWHWQDFAASTARTEPANAVLPTEDLLPTGGNEESQSTDDRPAVTGTSAEMVGDLWVGEEFTSCTQWIAAAPQLPRTALPKTEPMDPAGVSAGKPSATSVVLARPDPPAGEVQGRMEFTWDIRIPADVQAGGGEGQPSEAMPPLPGTVPQDGSAASTRGIPSDFGQTPGSHSTTPGRTATEVSPATQGPDELPFFRLRDTRGARNYQSPSPHSLKPVSSESHGEYRIPAKVRADFAVSSRREGQPSARTAQVSESGTSEASNDRLNIPDQRLHATRTIDAARIESRTRPSAVWRVPEPEASKSESGQAAESIGPLKCSDQPLTAMRTIDAAWIEYKYPTVTGKLAAAKWTEVCVPGKESREPSVDISKQETPAPASRETHSQTQQISERNAVEPALTVFHPESRAESGSISFTRESGNAGRGPEVERVSAQSADPAVKPVPGTDETAGPSEGEPAAQSKPQSGELPVNAVRSSRQATVPSDPAESNSPRASIRSSREATLPQSSGLPKVGGGTVNHSGRPGTVLEEGIPLIQRGPLPVDMQAFSLRERSLQSHPARSRTLEPDGIGSIQATPLPLGDGKRVAVWTGPGMPIPLDPDPSPAAAGGLEGVEPAVPDSDKDTKARQADLHPVPSDENARADRPDNQPPGAPSPNAGPNRSQAQDAGNPMMLRAAQAPSSRDTVTAAGAAQQTGQETAADFRMPSTIVAARTSGVAPEPEFLTQLTARLQTQLREGENVLRIQLKPSSLGRLEIRAESSGHGLVATILAETAAVREYLQSNLHVLQQSFQDQGLKVDRIQVGVQEGSWFHHPSAGHQESRSHGEHRNDDGTPTWYSNAYEQEMVETIHDPLPYAVLKPHSTFHTVA